MAQDFYFKFFAREFLTSKEVRVLSLEDQAILIRLWCVCCLEGVLPEDLEELSMASGVKQVFLQKFEHLFEQFFKRDETGHRFSPRMEREREKSNKTREARSEAGKASGAARRRKIETDLIDAQTNNCSNTCSNSHSHSHKENKRPRPGGNLNQGMGTEGAGFEIPEPAEGVA